MLNQFASKHLSLVGGAGREEREGMLSGLGCHVCGSGLW